MQFVPSRQRVSLTFAGSDFNSRSSNVNAQTCINWYPVLSGPRGKGKAVLYPTPGAMLTRAIGSGNFRGAVEFKGDSYWVSGLKVIKMDVYENVTTLAGSLNPGSGPVSIATSGSFGNQIMIVDGTYGYTCDGTTVTQIADLDFPSNATAVEFLDARFIVTVANSGNFYISNLNDATGWTATLFANAERDPDNLVRPITNNRDLLLLGEKVSELWTNTGGSPMPFEVYSNGVIDKGCGARFSAAKADDVVYWLTDDRRGSREIIGAKGLSYKVISSAAMEYQISTYDTVSDAEAFTYSEHGTTFYQITFPSAGVTWVCNLGISESDYAWFQKKTQGTRHLASTYLWFNNKHYIGSYNSSSLYSMESTTYVDGSSAIVRERTGFPIYPDEWRSRVRHYSIELEFEAGQGLVTGQGVNPTVALDWSDDGGHTWSNVRTAVISPIGQYAGRCFFHHLGQSRNRIYRMRVSDPVKWVFIDAYLDCEELAH